jgi:hypothetical protein
MAWEKRNAPTLLLGVALLAAAALLIALGWDLTFFQDTWAVLLERPGFTADSLLTPHNEHLLAFQVALEKLWIELFGMDSAHPEMLTMVAALLAAATLLFVYVRRRVGAWPALFAAVLMLFLGAAWQVLLWPFELVFPLPLAAGIGMLLMLDREDRRGDVWACLLLVLSLGFGSMGLSFALAALVDVFLKRDRRGWGRLWVPFVPVFLYGLWYLGWGSDAETHLTLRNILDSPQYVFEGAAAAIGSLSGLDTIGTTGQGEPIWGRPLLIALVGLAIWRLRRRPLPQTFWPVAAAALSYWLLAAFNYIPGREAYSSRYVYVGAALVLLLAAELLRGVRFSPRAILVGAVLTVLAVGPNLVQLKDGADWLEQQTVLTRADTAAIEIAERTVDPGFTLTPEIAGTASLINVDAAEFLPAAREHGSPAYTPAELATAPAAGRRQADIVLSQALPLSTRVVPGLFRLEVARSCTRVGGAAPGAEVELGPGPARIEVAPGPEAEFSLRRFASGEYPVRTAGAPGDSLTILRVPADKAPQPWYLLVEASQPAFVCP